MTHATLPAAGRTSAPAVGNLVHLTDLQRVFFGYLADYDGKTRDAYEYHLGRFITWCTENNVEPLDVDRTHAALYVRHLTEGCELRPSTVNTCMTPVKGFYKWAMLEGFIDRDPIVHVRLPRAAYRQKYPLDREELRRFRAAGKAIGGRHWALTELLVVHALRASEACGLLIEDCQEAERGHRVMRLRRKGGSWSTIPLPIVVQMALDDAAGDRRTGPVIVCRDGHPMGRNGVAGLVRTVVRRAGIDKPVNPHLIRASVVTVHLDGGGDIREAQRLAGHQDPRTTSRHYDLSKRNHDTHPSHIVSARLTV